MKNLKRVIYILLLLILVFAVYLAIKTANVESKQLNVEAIVPIPVRSEAKINLSEAIKIKSISREESLVDSSAFFHFIDFLSNTYPDVESEMRKVIINDLSLLYEWQGSDSDKKPIILMAHYDVVPVPEKNIPLWNEDPFGGTIKNDAVWGRGALDQKFSIIALMETIQLLVKEGYQPSRTIYLSFGHDEETGGERGTKYIVEYLKERKIQPAMVLDEGNYIMRGIVPGIEKDVAIIGTAEKGDLTIEMNVNIEGGHSSIPRNETAIDVLSTAISKLKQKPFPPKICKPVQGFFNYIAPEMPFVTKMAMTNTNIFKPLIIGMYKKSPETSSLIRTTTAPTIFQSGVKDNVIPKTAEAKVNFRLLPGDSKESVLEYVRNVVDDERISINVQDYFPPSSVSDTEGEAFKILTRTIKETFPDIVTVPNLTIAGTDSKYYHAICENVFRFQPSIINKENIASFHGINEKMSVSEFENGIRFYYQLIRNADKESF